MRLRLGLWVDRVMMMVMMMRVVWKRRSRRWEGLWLLLVLMLQLLRGGVLGELAIIVSPAGRRWAGPVVGSRRRVLVMMMVPVVVDMVVVDVVMVRLGLGRRWGILRLLLLLRWRRRRSIMIRRRRSVPS